jgi:hypothetical protein
MLRRPFLNDAGSCASYLFGCNTPLPAVQGADVL